MYDTGEAETPTGPLPYIVMEYVEGVTLRDIVHNDGPMEPKRAIEVIADACQALNFSHQHGIIHRDVKPANIMISKTGAVKVMDFGIARALADANSVTQTAAVIGTAQYLSPEQARGEKVDARSDVYSLGCVLYEILTGEPPFIGDSPVAVATSMSARIRYRRRSAIRRSVPNSTRWCSSRWPRTPPTTATRRPPRCAPIWCGCTAVSSRTRRRCSPTPSATR